MWLKLLTVGAASVGANFFWQAVDHQLWMVAFERSVFQISALIVAGMYLAVPTLKS